ncbi:hypothetical protein [Blastococcus saxobsidens]|uniref:hypothetical protein n=1 Tax=Blastococcus saxobsidens TaxID=138336 RepID=UPI001EF76E41|nr:hypothetical protein [Blastococcus saxobsidens]
MRAVQITRFGGPEVLDVVDVPEPEAGPGQKVYDVSTAGFLSSLSRAATKPPCPPLAPRHRAAAPGISDA